jgi:hypothetical protein
MDIPLTAEHQVFRLYVSVDDSITMHKLQAKQYAGYEELRLLFSEGSLST